MLGCKEDLLAFQLSHFGDDTKPEDWFVDAQTAIDYDPATAADEEEDLGYYDDGVKRTLTDEQIAMFRHSEIQQLVRDGIAMKEEQDEDAREGVEATVDAELVNGVASEASSMEEELQNVAAPTQPVLAKQPLERLPTPSMRSETSLSSSSAKRMREKEVPYDQRNKRKWEGYVEDVDPEQGSLTQRRIIRELDVQRHEEVELDY